MVKYTATILFYVTNTPSTTFRKRRNNTEMLLKQCYSKQPSAATHFLADRAI